ncbi:hypothetical protein AVEN_245147-1 [Araneus ventricosus]|uniref:DDE-1 domain-containing protein n=1 Tax=Araneus ventricosus TaxID=182803 RepID=A0A4Y2TWH8_ARAVE|nr:hypothetical protein AVEN_245147-1 [Araneus ventricosus]
MISFRICSICKKKNLKSQKLPTKALLVLDNVPSGEELKDGNIQAVFLRPNLMALIKPMDQGVKESVKRRYRRKLLTALSEEDGKNTIVIDFLKEINIKAVYMIAKLWSELPESTLVKSWQKIELSNQIGEEEDVDAEDVEQWLAIDKGLQQETLSDEVIVAAVTDGVQDDDDGDDIVEHFPHISYGWNESFRSGIMLCGAAVSSFPH